MSGLHIPKAGFGGEFISESGNTVIPLPLLIADDSFPINLDSYPAVDHDARVVKILKREDTFSASLSPAAVELEYTAAGRAQRYPRSSYERDGETFFYTQWTFFAGNEVAVTPRDGGTNTRRYYDEVIRYDGESASNENYATQSQDVTAHDFQWEFTFGSGAGASTRLGTEYRKVEMRRYNVSEVGYFAVLELIQGHVQNIYLPGEVPLGWVNVRYSDETEVTGILGYQYQDGSVTGTYVNAWTNIGRLEAQQFGPRPSDAVPIKDTDGVTFAYALRSAGAACPLLRETRYTAWPPEPEMSDLSFTAAGGAVTVRGPRGMNLGKMQNQQGQAFATLTAYGRTFEGGSWAALRDAPKRSENGTLDFSPHLILHASAATISAVRPNRSVQTCSRAAFEREVLRVPVGTFQGFNSVGTLFNTWPPQWAFADCGGEQRAVAAFDPWRDCVKGSAPEGQPPHWYWPGRPGKRPNVNPLAPTAPLGLTLADVVGTVIQDEALARFEAPLRLPVSANPADALSAVSKRLLYQPANWPEELDDSKSAPMPLSVTFLLPAPPGEFETWEAALLLRLKGPGELTINGELAELRKLGHNADNPRGWHSYTVGVPVVDVYTLNSTGRISRALLCVRIMPVPTAGPDA